MRIGSFEIVRKRKVRKTIEEKVGDYIGTEEVRALVAKIARSEVKNYMAWLAEEAEMPWTGPVDWLGKVR